MRGTPPAVCVRHAWTALCAMTLAALLGAVAILAPSPAGGSPTVALAASSQQPAEWTFLIYGVLDTDDVADELSQDLATLVALPDDPKVNIVALVDMPEQGDAGYPSEPLPGLAPFTDAKLLLLDGGRWNEVRDEGELSMGRPDTLASFINEAVDRFPAQHYGISLLDHGGAWFGGYLDHGPPSPSLLSISAMREGLLQGIQDSGIGRFDVLFHAACMMSSYEVDSALAPTAKVMAGSEELMFGSPIAESGFDPLYDGGTGADVANALVDGYGSYLDQLAQQPGGQQLRDLAAMAVVDSDAMTNLDAAMQSFSQAAVAHMSEIAVQVAKARSESLKFQIGLEPDAGDYDIVDLGDFLRHLTDVPDDVAVARDAAFAALQHAVTHQVLGQGTQQATGFNVYLPLAKDAQDFKDLYVGNGAPPWWEQFISSFLDVATGQGGQGGEQGQGGTGVRFVSPQAKVLQADSAGIKIAGQLGSGGSSQVTASETQVFTRVGGEDDGLGVVLPAYVDAGGEGQVEGVWDYSLTVLSDGQKVVPGTSVYQGQQDGLRGTMLAQYTSPEGDSFDVAIQTLLSSQGEIQSAQVVAVSDSGQSAAGVTLEAGGKLTPYVFVASSGSFDAHLSTQSIKVSDALSIGFSKLPSGTPFTMGVVVQDVSGSTDAATVAGTVP